MFRDLLRGSLGLAALAFALVSAEATEVLPASSAFPVSPMTALPDLNWEDFPIKPTLEDYVTYNDNVYALSKGQGLLLGQKTRGDFYNLTQVGAQSKFYLGQQVLNLNGTYGVTRYLNDTVANSNQYNLNGILNWAFTSRCTGTLTATISKLPSVAEEQIGTGINDVKTQSFGETAKCLVWGGFSLLANSGVNNSKNSAGLNALVDYNSKYVSAGVGYDWSALDNSQLLYKRTDRMYPNQGASIFGLASDVLEDEVTASYQRFFNDNLNASAMIGLSKITLISPTAPMRSTVAPEYSLGLTWQALPKLQLQAGLSRSVGAPTSILVNSQVSTTASLSANYVWSQKTSFSAAFSVNDSTGAFINGLSGPTFSQDQKSYSASLTATYQVTPFISSNLNYTYSDRVGGGLDTVVNRVVVSMRYLPY